MSGDRRKGGAESHLDDAAPAVAAKMGRIIGGLGAEILGVAVRKARAAATTSLSDAQHEEMRRVMDVDPNVRNAPESQDFGPCYTYGDRTVHADIHDIIVAHEYGHAVSPMMPTRDAARAASMMRDMLADMAEAARLESERAYLRTLADGGDAGAAARAKQLEDDLFAARVASSRRILEEIQATAHGLAAIDKVGGPKATLDAAKILIPAALTYVAQATGDHVVASLAGRLLGHIDRILGKTGADDE